MLKYDQMVVSSEKYVKKDLPVPHRLIYPAINPLSPKNVPIADKIIKDQLARAGVPTDKPIITQVSRLDPWKDPEGVIDVFKLVKEKVDCRLMLCYNVASDDPEGLQMYKKVQRKGNKLLQDGDILLVVGNSETLVNAVQRFSRVIIQKSTKEGFCLAVTEALWKGTPVVASNVGGIPSQIEDGKSGFLLEPTDTGIRGSHRPPAQEPERGPGVGPRRPRDRPREVPHHASAGGLPRHAQLRDARASRLIELPSRSAGTVAQASALWHRHPADDPWAASPCHEEVRSHMP